MTLSFSHWAIITLQLKYNPEYLQTGSQIIINEKNLKLCGSINQVFREKFNKEDKLNRSSWSEELEDTEQTSVSPQRTYTDFEK